MSLTATYDPILSRIRLSATLLGATATRAAFWRTTNGGVTYDSLRGGWPVAVSGQNAAVDDYEFPAGVPVTYRVRSFTDADLTPIVTFDVTITQDLDLVWLKVPAAPYLNQPVKVADRSAVKRRSRAGVFDVVSRTLPVAVGDIASSREFTLELLTETPTDEQNLDYLFASGEIVLLHTPSTVQHFPGGYYSVGDVERETTLRTSLRRIWTVPLREVAAPGPDVIGPVYTWTSVLSNYATWNDLLAANASWSALLQRTGSPSDVIVP